MAEPDRLFTRELGGETAPDARLMNRLLSVAGELWKAAPWKDDLGDRELIAVDPRDGSERCYCVFMGTLGEVFGMHAYIGDDGYELYDTLVNGEETGGVEHLGRLRALSVEFVHAGALAAQDRTALKCGWPAGKGRKPKFRAWRPGYHPWFVNEAEALRLCDCLEAVVSFLNQLASSPVAWWQTEGTFPLARFRENAWYFEPASEPAPPAGGDQFADPDPDLVASARGLPKKGTMEAAHLYAPAEIGERHERKALLRCALGVDTASGMLLSPELAPPEARTGDLLNKLVLQACLQRKAVPARVHLRSREDAALLQPLARALGFQTKVVAATPALDHAFESMLRFLASR